MRYYTVKNRLVASPRHIHGGKEISREIYEEMRQALHNAAVEYAKNNPPPVEIGEEATEADYLEALAEMGVET